MWCNNIAWHCHDLVVRWRHLSSYIKYILLVRHLGFVCVLLYIARSGLLHVAHRKCYFHGTGTDYKKANRVCWVANNTIVIKLYYDLNFFTVQLPMFLPSKPSQNSGRRYSLTLRLWNFYIILAVIPRHSPLAYSDISIFQGQKKILEIIYQCFFNLSSRWACLRIFRAHQTEQICGIRILELPLHR